MTKRPPKPPKADVQPLSKQANEIAENGLAGIGECITLLREQISSGDIDRASELALLTHKAAQIMGEARKRENDEAKQDITDAVLVDHFRKLTPDRRAQWVKDLSAMDRKGSVLG